MSSRSVIVLLLAPGLVIAGCDRQSPAPSQANATMAAPAPDEVAPAAAAAPVGGQVDRSHKGEAAPTTAFEDAGGKPATLAAFTGKPLLVNLWATWCAPCVKEMPTLDRLAAQGKLKVIAVSQDMDAAKAAPFFAQEKLTALTPYRDPKLGLSLAYGANLPTTVLYDAAGKEVWRYTGGLDWTGAEATKLLGEAS